MLQFIEANLTGSFDVREPPDLPLAILLRVFALRPAQCVRLVVHPRVSGPVRSLDDGFGE